MSNRKLKIGIARLNKNLDVVINLENGVALTINRYKLVDLVHERVPFVDVIRKPCRGNRCK